MCATRPPQDLDIADSSGHLCTGLGDEEWCARRGPPQRLAPDTLAPVAGQVTVNHKRASADYILENGDFMCNWLHRCVLGPMWLREISRLIPRSLAHSHEPPVVAGPVRIVYDGRVPGNDGETLVVEKPGSIPVHATGRYHFNSLLEILKHDYSLPLVHTLNRLDRLTSGLMVCALTVDASKRLGKYFNNQQVRKEYVARCCGNFPECVGSLLLSRART